jgi:hypothetical protein
LFDKAQATLVEYPSALGGSYTIPDSVTSIGNSAFDGCQNLASVVIPGSVTNIGQAAFFQCSGLTNILIPESVTSIGGGAFENCAGLANITIPGGVTTIALSTFSDDFNLRGVYFTGNAPAVITGFSFTPNLFTVYYLPGTTGWGTTFGSGLPFDRFPPAVVEWNPLIQTSDGSFGVRNNQFGFNITGTNNFTVVVEACTNLASPVWTPLTNATLVNGSFYFSDPQWTNYPSRFYGLGLP